VRIAATSKWAMKNSGFALRNTTTRTAGSAASRWASVAVCRNSSTVNRLIGGLSMVTVAMPASAPLPSSTNSPGMPSYPDGAPLDPASLDPASVSPVSLMA
jgi:hypothetical protein